MDYLELILDRKRQDLKKLLPLEGKLRASAILRNEYGGFAAMLDAGEDRLSLVAEIAMRDPVSGYEESRTSPEQYCAMFSQGGAHAISIVTEQSLHGGSMALLSQVSRISTLPVLARDWYTHPVEICQAAVCGADAVNLIAAILPGDQLQSLYELSRTLGLNTMIEVHTLDEMERALDLDPDLICINHLDPHTFISDPDTTEKLIDEVPADVIVLSSGGIESPADALKVLECGANGIITSQPLMRSSIPQEVIASFLDVRLPGIEEEF